MSFRCSCEANKRWFGKRWPRNVAWSGPVSARRRAGEKEFSGRACSSPPGQRSSSPFSCRVSPAREASDEGGGVPAYRGANARAWPQVLAEERWDCWQPEVCAIENTTFCFLCSLRGVFLKHLLLSVAGTADGTHLDSVGHGCANDLMEKFRFFGLFSSLPPAGCPALGRWEAMRRFHYFFNSFFKSPAVSAASSSFQSVSTFLRKGAARQILGKPAAQREGSEIYEGWQRCNRVS